MANDLTFGGSTGLMSRDTLAKSLNNASMSMPTVGSDVQYLKMDKGNGEWLYGQEETLVGANTLWAVNPHSFMHGWISWDTATGGPPLQEHMVSIMQPLPAVNSLPPVPSHAAYKQQRSVQLVCIKDPDAKGADSDVGVTCEYKQSSYGAMKLFKTITDAVLAQITAGSDAIVPIVQLTHESYKHDKYGRVTNPVFKIVDWRTMNDTSAPSEVDEVAEEEAALEEEYAAAAAEVKLADTPRRRDRNA